jgi:hypothetical protein
MQVARAPRTYRGCRRAAPVVRIVAAWPAYECEDLARSRDEPE